MMLLHVRSFFKFLCFSLEVLAQYEPQFYHQTLPFDHWRKAMKLELKVMEEKNTWEIVPSPPSKHISQRVQVNIQD